MQCISEGFVRAVLNVECCGSLGVFGICSLRVAPPSLFSSVAIWAILAQVARSQSFRTSVSGSGFPALCSNMADVTWPLAPRGVKRSGFGMRCSCKCQFPGWLTPCSMCCVLVQGHSFACVCLRHRATPSAPPLPAVPRPGLCVRGPEPQLRADRFGAVVKVVEQWPACPARHSSVSRTA